MRKNIRTIPKHIANKLESLQGNTITTFAFLKMSKQDIVDGKYNHLNISLNNDILSYPEYLIPNSSSGRYSKYNTDGREIPLKNLPKIQVSHYIESPNFGDSSKGYHTTTITHYVWKKKIIPPRFLALIFNPEVHYSDSNYILKIHIDTPMIKSSIDFNDDLLFQCNLLQENIGNFDVTDINIENENYIEMQFVNWELLHPGKLDIDTIITKIINPRDIKNAGKRAFVKERLEFFNTLGAISYIKGTSKFSSYTGAKFPNDIVLLENFDYGNAVYILKENWEPLSMLSRTELLSHYKDSIIRIKHTINWKNNIRICLQSLTN